MRRRYAPFEPELLGNHLWKYINYLVYFLTILRQIPMFTRLLCHNGIISLYYHVGSGCDYLQQKKSVDNSLTLWRDMYAKVWIFPTLVTSVTRREALPRSLPQLSYYCLVSSFSCAGRGFLHLSFIFFYFCFCFTSPHPPLSTQLSSTIKKLSGEDIKHTRWQQRLQEVSLSYDNISSWLYYQDQVQLELTRLALGSLYLSRLPPRQHAATATRRVRCRDEAWLWTVISRSPF